jgi:hypothetical protein
VSDTLDYNALPVITDARLPATYEAAKQALAECVQVDECQTWADKAAALASYAKQSEDKALFTMARRIQARAIDRVGELLREIRPARGANQNIKGGASPNVKTRKDAARDAGLSPDQAKQALRVNNVPRDQFDALVESDEPPSVTRLAELGTEKASPDYLNGRDPTDFENATRFIGLAKDILRRGKAIDLSAANRGLGDNERAALAQALYDCAVWIHEAREVINGL